MRDPFDKPGRAFAGMAVLALLLNLIFWGAILVGALFILRAFGVL